MSVQSVEDVEPEPKETKNSFAELPEVTVVFALDLLMSATHAPGQVEDVEVFVVILVPSTDMRLDTSICLRIHILMTNRLRQSSTIKSARSTFSDENSFRENLR